ncbi:hypothetical protein [Corynebacterium senegalense]|uniref:hypothetical protein n=1 Tax=Corynebacterium senegalense TaxID=2080750 RepID=UPI000E2099EC|nr:hypothetical protein [Corynebacterium senegalense]
MHRHTPARLAAAAVTAAALALAGCASDETTEPGSPTGQATETTATTATTEAAETTEASTTTGAAEVTSTSASDRKLVDDVAARFSTLAPASLFAQFDTCSPTGMAGSYDCSGPEIGQFQLFDSDAKAASTTQLLTELRSSRIVEDNGTRVVGWSTLGTSAIITVVDNEKGQVMQQLISSDQEDPRERIYKLGLADKDAAGETATETTAETTPANPS